VTQDPEAVIHMGHIPVCWVQRMGGKVSLDREKVVTQAVEVTLED
jgi:hypothetical protein